MLETFFQDPVRDGCWAPRHPATDPAELARLEQSAVRGDCISPLLREGDTVFIDPGMAAEPGDIASFRLSARGADAQNSCLPPGQSPWAVHSRWCKLLAVSHGFQMLLDRHGNSATATLMACEDPDDEPELHPVRQVRRAGKLLFTQDTHASQLGLNSATLVSVVGASSVAITGTLASPQILLSVTVPAQTTDSQVVCSFIGNLTAVSAASPGCGVWAYVATAPNVTYDATAGNARVYAAAAGATSVNAAMFEETFSQSAGSAATYNVYAFRTGGGAGATGAVSGCEVKAEVIKR